MASEPQPSNVHEGADADGHPAPSNAEDRKAAAAMDKLDQRGAGDDEEGGSKKDVDAEALGKAMKNLDVKESAEKLAEKKVKVEAVDVTLLVSALMEVFVVTALHARRTED